MHIEIAKDNTIWVVSLCAGKFGIRIPETSEGVDYGTSIYRIYSILYFREIYIHIDCELDPSSPSLLEVFQKVRYQGRYRCGHSGPRSYIGDSS